MRATQATASTPPRSTTPTPPPWTRTDYGCTQPFPPPIGYCELGATLEQSKACAQWICFNEPCVIVQMYFVDCNTLDRWMWSYDPAAGCIEAGPWFIDVVDPTYCNSCPEPPPPCP